MSSHMPSAWVSLPGPLQRSSARSRPRRSRIASIPSTGSSARINAAAPTPSSSATAFSKRVDPVRAVHVGDARRAEQDARARRDPGVRMARRLLLVIALHLDDPAGALAMPHDAADEVACDVVHGPRVERWLARVRQPARGRARAARAPGRATSLPASASTRAIRRSRAPCGSPRDRRSAGASSAISSSLRSESARPLSTAVRTSPETIAVGLTERDALLDEQVRHVGGREHLVGGRLLEPLALEPDSPEHAGGRGEAERERVRGVEERLLVLLEVLVVGHRQPVESAVQPHQPADDPRRLRAQELGGVGVLLLGHDARARREAVGRPRRSRTPRSTRARSPRRAARGASRRWRPRRRSRARSRDWKQRPWSSRRRPRTRARARPTRGRCRS